jgi:cell division protein YceG involved in septum cleavage
MKKEKIKNICTAIIISIFIIIGVLIIFGSCFYCFYIDDNYGQHDTKYTVTIYNGINTETRVYLYSNGYCVNYNKISGSIYIFKDNKLIETLNGTISLKEEEIKLKNKEEILNE